MKANENEKMREWDWENEKKKIERENKWEKKWQKWLFITYSLDQSFSAHVPCVSQAHPCHRHLIFCARAIGFWFVEWLASIRWFGIILTIWVCLGEWGGWFNVVRGGKRSLNPFARLNPTTLIEPKPTQLLFELNGHQPK